MVVEGCRWVSRRHRVVGNLGRFTVLGVVRWYVSQDVGPLVYHVV